MLEVIDPSIILLAADAADNPLTRAEGLWGIIQTFFRAVGGIIVVLLIWKAVSAWTKGQTGEMGRTIIVGLIVATITFNLALPIQLAQSLGGVVSGVVDLISDIGRGDGSGSPSTPTNTTPSTPGTTWSGGEAGTLEACYDSWCRNG